MPVHYRDTAVEIVCGSIEENWVAFRPANTDETHITKCNDLTAENGFGELYDQIKTQTVAFEFNFDMHLPLNVEVNEQSIRVRTTNDEILFDRSPHQDLFRPDYFSKYNTPDGVQQTVLDEATEYTMELAEAIHLAHYQPRRFLFEYRDQLIDGNNDSSSGQ